MSSGTGAPKLYFDLAEWFHLLTAPEDYAEEAEFYTQQLIAASDGPVETVLELGSGGGNNASHMKARFKMTLTDLSEGMLALSQQINPELEHVQGDMRTLRLGDEFDAVFVHDAVVYMTTEADLRATIGTAHAHCRPGGVALFAPDYVGESVAPWTDHGGHDGEDGRGLRYLEWVWDPDPSDDTYTVDYAYLIREADGSVRVEQDRHIEGMFSRTTWLRLLDEVGFDAKAVPWQHSEVERETLEVFVGVKR
jgi:SAM-dependent methyltransferase